MWTARFKLVLPLFLFILFSFFLNPTHSFAQTDACDEMTALSVTPGTGDTNTQFTFTGTIKNCTKVGPAAFPKLFADDPAGGSKTFAAQITTDDKGNFTVKNVTFPGAGTWKVQGIIGPLEEIPGKTASVVIGSEQPKKCDDKVMDSPADKAKCPAECLATQVGADWICKRPVTLQNAACRTEGNKCDAPLVAEGEGADCKCILKAAAPAPVATIKPCSETQNCSNAAGKMCDNGDLSTAIGCVPIKLDNFINGLLRWTAGVAGGIAFLLMIFGSLQMVTSQGNPEQLKKGREQFVAAISGLLFIIFSITLLQIIGADILAIPGLER